MKKMTKFYDLVTLRFIQNFGDDLKDIRINPAEDLPDPEDFKEGEAHTAEEAATKTENFKIIRKVCIIPHYKRACC